MQEKTTAPETLPTHLALIMDGNGRWAQARGLERSAGHRAGAEAVHAVVAECRRLNIRYLTLYTFSTENWNRPKAEISVLFSLLTDFLSRELPLLKEKDIRLQTLGAVDALPFAQRTALAHAVQATRNNTSMVLNLALNYGARSELVRAVRAILEEGLRPDEVTEDVLAAHLYTRGQPDPDCVIRTSGEQRLSNYLLYQCAYSELIFTSVFWPDFSVAELHKALHEYARRKRRFGKTQEQVGTGDVP
ncbi:MAG: isoprenyl transferase [Desulfovibrionaceae bacterium]|nr:isoprenyl transferase [Desulfovibrionaceae bacterium]